MEGISSGKDDTDTELAVQTAAEIGAEEIHIVGGTGSRLDHMLANVYLLGLLRNREFRLIL